MENALDFLKEKLGEDNFEKIQKINNSSVHEFIAKYVELFEPETVYVLTGTEEDKQFIRENAVKGKEEAELEGKGHTIHFDGFYDQGRDKENTKYLVSEGKDLGQEINAFDRKEGLEEIHEIMKGIMKGRELYIKFFCLGPLNSEFSIPALQLTDSAYVAHSENLLYRQGYEQFLKLDEEGEFFKFVHSQGELQEAGLGLKVCKNVDKRRMYIDLEGETVYSANTQYGGNTIGLKKLAMRFGIQKASKEGWLTEHMLVMGVHGKDGRVSYFTGAFPSMCGKTSTAMLDGEKILGDDIAYIRNIEGIAKAVNVEKGVFGIIDGLNKKDDEVQWNALHSENEIIFSNILVNDGKEYWNGMGEDIPEKGVNYSGEWNKGKQGDGKELSASHKNARFTFDLEILDNVDENLHAPEGVKVDGFIYGGRDSDTSVPVEEAFDWKHGVITKGACLESETTAATLGAEGELAFNPMSNLDFLSIPIGRYVKDNLEFGEGLKEKPKIFYVNYFIQDSEGEFLNHKNDKHVWLKWMELRVHGEAEAIETPTGKIPKYEDLKRLFEETLGKAYSEKDYEKQFTIRVNEHLAKIERLKEIYTTRVKDTPPELFEVLEEQKKRLEKAKEEFGEYISPKKLA